MNRAIVKCCIQTEEADRNVFQGRPFRSRTTDRQVERDLDLYQGAIRRWRTEHNTDPVDAFPGTGHQKPLEEENRRLRRALATARQERGILKKAVAIFSKVQGPVPKMEFANDYWIYHRCI